MENKEFIDTTAIQGILLNPYGDLPCGAYCLIEVVDNRLARQWLAEIEPLITRADIDKPKQAINVAFTFTGLKAIGLQNAIAGTFSQAFEEGMVSDHRTRILGDTDASEPAQWIWGGPKEEQEFNATRIHILLMIFGSTAAEVKAIQNQLLCATDGCKGIQLLFPSIVTTELSEYKEHFGFRDGVSQPIIAGTYQEARFAAQEIPSAVIKAGEFILGFQNQYDQQSLSPLVKTDSNAVKNLFPTSSDAERDFGKFGTYLVVRDLAQDVAGFWLAVKSAAEPFSSESEIDALAEKLVGRSLDGAPLAVSDNSAGTRMNKFTYKPQDAQGFGCPIGAHVRRANPRDSLGDDASLALETTQAHRIIRRGRSYGIPKLGAARYQADHENRGLFFICLNANIERQFEFIQGTWLNNPNFSRLCGENDPLTGDPKRAPEGFMTIQAQPIRKRLRNLQRYVTTQGGAYFFLPGIAALRYLSQIV